MMNEFSAWCQVVTAGCPSPMSSNPFVTGSSDSAPVPDTNSSYVDFSGKGRGPSS